MIQEISILNITDKGSSIEITISHPLSVNHPVLMLRCQSPEERQRIMNDLPKQYRIRTKTVKTSKGTLILSTRTPEGTEMYSIETGSKR